MTESLNRNILYSVGGHLGVVLLIFFQAVLIPSEPIDLRQAIRVDIVGLPEKMTEQTLKPKASDPVSEVKKPKPAAVKPVETKPAAPKVDLSKSQQKALTQIKSLQALEKIKDQLKTDKEKAAQTTVVKGNQVNEGNSLTGLEKIAFDRYFSDLEAKIRSAWSIPQWLADANFKAQIKIMIDERGYVIKKIVTKSSGNDVFDNSVIAAIENSSPLPVPPKRLIGLLKTSGLILNFPE